MKEFVSCIFISTNLVVWIRCTYVHVLPIRSLYSGEYFIDKVIYYHKRFVSILNIIHIKLSERKPFADLKSKVIFMSNLKSLLIIKRIRVVFKREIKLLFLVFILDFAKKI